ncbi:MAG: TonB-dependent receptor [Cytophagales bacterium]|nr:TonB-dependent receptor [Cytophagales bacterium]
MDQIEDKTDFFFAYASTTGLNQKLSYHSGKISVGELLRYISENSQLEFKRVNETIHISSKAVKSAIVSEVLDDNYLQGTTVSGKVISDDDPSGLPGVNIMVKGTSIGTVTDVNGKYRLSVPDQNSILVFSSVGFISEEIIVGDKTIIDITLVPDITALEEIVVVGFAKQKKESVVASITTIEPADLKVPSSNLTTALAGKMSGIIAYQRTGEPGYDNAQFFIRGVTTFGYKRDPLILIDGIELTADDLARMHPDDIESFSILKDATATAIYGARGANGVILVNTKEGFEGKVKVNVRYEKSYSMPTQEIEMADPITWMELYNEAVKTRDPLGILPYSPSKVDKTKAGVNPYAYPAVDWRDQMLNDVSDNHRFNINVSGGGKAVRYYLATSYTNDNGIFKEDPNNNYDSNIRFDRVNVRSNTSINLTKSTEAVLRVNGAFDDYTGPVHGGSTIFDMVQRAKPVAFPMFYPNTLGVQHILFGNSNEGNELNPYAEMVKGYKEWSKSNILAQVELKQDLSFLADGLSARIMANTTRYSYFDITRSTNPFYYTSPYYNIETDDLNLIALNEEEGREYLDFNESDGQVSTTFYLQGILEYNKVFKEKHALGGLLVFIRQNRLSNGNKSLQKSLPYRNQGVSGRLTYAYDGKYFTEFNFGYNGSERFSEKHRYGFFPSVGLGWAVDKESFWGPLSNTFSRLKLRASYGLVGNDAIGDADDRFFYLSQVNLDDSGRGATFGQYLDYSRDGVSINRYANDQISWETGIKTNLGIELGMFNDDLEIIADLFYEDRENILMDRSYIPPSMGLQNTVRANVGKAKSQGFDMSVNYNRAFSNGVWLQAMGNFTYATSEFKYFEEPDFGEATWRYHAGQSLNQQWAYIAERLFVDDNEVVNSPVQFGEYGAGDIKYRDINDDGKIDENDRVPIGYPTTPEIIYGFGFSTGYKGFDFSCFFQGSARSSFWIDPVKSGPFIDYDNRDVSWDNNLVTSNGLLQVIADDHWSEDNPNVYAMWPRLSITDIPNNTVRSTYFMQDGSFMRLKQLEIGYTIPQRWADKIYLNSMRFYVSGRNLLTFSKFKLWDPEMAGNGLGYPIQKVYNLGLQVNF